MEKDILGITDICPYSVSVPASMSREAVAYMKDHEVLQNLRLTVQSGEDEASSYLSDSGYRSRGCLEVCVFVPEAKPASVNGNSTFRKKPPSEEPVRAKLFYHRAGQTRLVAKFSISS